MISMDPEEVASGVSRIREGTTDFDATVAKANPDSGDTGGAAAILADILSVVADTSLRLAYELDTLANAASASIKDAEANEQTVQDWVHEFEVGLP